MTELPIPRVVEAAIAATLAALVAGVIAWRIDTDVVLLPSLVFLLVFLATLWRTRSSTIHHRSGRRARPRTRRGED